MSSFSDRLMDENMNTYAVTTAAAAAGGALGLLFGRGMERRSSNIAALTLLAAGALLAVPAMTHVVSRIANRPSGTRGSRKRLEGIRNGSAPVENADIYSLEEEF